MNFSENTLLNGNFAVSASPDGRERSRDASIPDHGKVNVSESHVWDVGTKEITGPSNRAGVTKETIPLYRKYREPVDSILCVAGPVANLDDESFSDSWAGASAQIDEDLERLYDTPWGEGDSLKKVIAVVQGIVGNAVWTKNHAAYVVAIATELRCTYQVNHDLAVKVSRMAKEFDLDRFRGTVTEGTSRKKYMLVEQSG